MTDFTNNIAAARALGRVIISGIEYEAIPFIQMPDGSVRLIANHSKSREEAEALTRQFQERVDQSVAKHPRSFENREIERIDREGITLRPDFARAPLEKLVVPFADHNSADPVRARIRRRHGGGSEELHNYDRLKLQRDHPELYQALEVEEDDQDTLCTEVRHLLAAPVPHRFNRAAALLECMDEGSIHPGQLSEFDRDLIRKCFRSIPDEKRLAVAQHLHKERREGILESKKTLETHYQRLEGGISDEEAFAHQRLTDLSKHPNFREFASHLIELLLCRDPNRSRSPRGLKKDEKAIFFYVNSLLVAKINRENPGHPIVHANFQEILAHLQDLAHEAYQIATIRIDMIPDALASHIRPKEAWRFAYIESILSPNPARRRLQFSKLILGKLPQLHEHMRMLFGTGTDLKGALRLLDPEISHKIFRNYRLCSLGARPKWLDRVEDKETLDRELAFELEERRIYDQEQFYQQLIEIIENSPLDKRASALRNKLARLFKIGRHSEELREALRYHFKYRG